MFDYDKWHLTDVAKISQEGRILGKYLAKDFDHAKFILFSNFPHLVNGIGSSTIGWKTHISVKKEHVDLALGIVLELCDKHDLGTFQVAHPRTGDVFVGGDRLQSGKVFTLYHEGIDVRHLLQEIESRFTAAGIKPGSTVKGDRPVPGSRYLSMRNDYKPGHKRQLLAEDIIRMRKINPRLDPSNPFGLANPYWNFRV
ncbi:hypothetical protein [Cupriavidus necator]